MIIKNVIIPLLTAGSSCLPSAVFHRFKHLVVLAAVVLGGIPASSWAQLSLYSAKRGNALRIISSEASLVVRSDSNSSRVYITFTSPPSWLTDLTGTRYADPVPGVDSLVVKTGLHKQQVIALYCHSSVLQQPIIKATLDTTLLLFSQVPQNSSQWHVSQRRAQNNQQIQSSSVADTRQTAQRSHAQPGTKVTGHIAASQDSSTRKTPCLENIEVISKHGIARVYVQFSGEVKHFSKRIEGNVHWVLPDRTICTEISSDSIAQILGFPLEFQQLKRDRRDWVAIIAKTDKQILNLPYPNGISFEVGAYHADQFAYFNQLQRYKKVVPWKLSSVIGAGELTEKAVQNTPKAARVPSAKDLVTASSLAGVVQAKPPAVHEQDRPQRILGIANQKPPGDTARPVTKKASITPPLSQFSLRKNEQGNAVLDNDAQQVAQKLPGETVSVRYRSSSRDPFMPVELEKMWDMPDLQSVRLVGILHDNKDKMVLMEDPDEPGRNFVLHPKDPVRGGMVWKILADRVIFLITEMGISRTVEMKLPEKVEE